VSIADASDGQQRGEIIPEQPTALHKIKSCEKHVWCRREFTPTKFVQ
jgi:hypothetical protein